MVDGAGNQWIGRKGENHNMESTLVGTDLPIIIQIKWITKQRRIERNPSLYEFAGSFHDAGKIIRRSAWFAGGGIHEAEGDFAFVDQFHLLVVDL